MKLNLECTFSAAFTSWYLRRDVQVQQVNVICELGKMIVGDG